MASLAFVSDTLRSFPFCHINIVHLIQCPSVGLNGYQTHNSIQSNSRCISWTDRCFGFHRPNPGFKRRLSVMYFSMKQHFVAFAGRPGPGCVFTGDGTSNRNQSVDNWAIIFSACSVSESPILSSPKRLNSKSWFEKAADSFHFGVSGIELIKRSANIESLSTRSKIDRRISKWTNWHLAPPANASVHLAIGSFPFSFSPFQSPSSGHQPFPLSLCRAFPRGPPVLLRSDNFDCDRGPA